MQQMRDKTNQLGKSPGSLVPPPPVPLYDLAAFPLVFLLQKIGSKTGHFLTWRGFLRMLQLYVSNLSSLKDGLRALKSVHMMGRNNLRKLRVQPNT